MNSNLLNFILFGLALQNQNAVPSSSTAASSISGVVLRAPTDTPLSRVTVDLRSTDSAGEISTTTTGDDGRFIFPHLPPGEYQVTAMRSGYVPTAYGQRMPSGPAVSIEVAVNQKIDKIRIIMSPTGTISGRILGPDGVVGNAIVQALKTSFQDGKPAMTPVKEAVTNDLGEYRLFGLPPGKYYVDVLARSETQGSDSLVVNSQGSNGFSAGRAQGQLDAGRDNAPQRNETYIPTFYPGVVSRNSATSIDVVSGEEISNIDIIAARVHFIRIRGTVVDDRSGEPVAALGLQLIPLEGPTSRAISFRPDSTAKKGEFDFSNVVPGSYILRAEYGGMSGRLAIEARDRDIDNVSLRMLGPIRIPFHVSVEQQNGRLPDPAIVTSLGIGSAPVPFILSLYASSMRLPPDGTGTLPGLLPGNYRLYVGQLLDIPRRQQTQFPEALANAYVKSIRLGETDILKSGLHVDLQPEGTIEIVIGTTPGAITGRVLGPGGGPAPGAVVVALPNEDRDYRIDMTRNTSTDATGNFRLDRLPPGDYKLFAWEAVERNVWLDPEFMSNYEESGHPFHVSEGASQIMILPAIPGP